jgi:F-type H+-transporting ATPase subunit b
MEILRNFGFEPVFFVAQIINFLILAAIFKRYLYKPVLKMLHDREEKIAHGLRDAESATKALADADERKDEIIREATLAAEKIIEETKKSAENLRESLAMTAKQEAEKIVRGAREAANLEFENAKTAAEKFSIDLSKKVLDRVLSEIFTKEEKTKIIERNTERFIDYGKS